MAIPKNISAQRDFSAGEVDPSIKRDDDNKLLKKGARQMSDWRILNTKGVTNRPGRRALFADGPRVEEVLMAPAVSYYLVFGNLSLKVRDATGAVVFTDTARPWTSATARNVVWAIYGKSVTITYPGMVPRILSWDGVTTWTAADFVERTLASGQKRTPFYRIAPPGITLLPSASSGNITLTASSPYFVAGMVGTRVRYHGKQITITGFTSNVLVNATVNETLNTSGPITVGSGGAGNLTGTFNVGDEVQGSTTGAKGYVATATFAAGAWTLGIIVLTAKLFAGGAELIVGPSGQGMLTVGGPNAFYPSVVWDEEVMNTYRGWPASCFVDQNRLGLCNFPSVPSGIAWSALGLLDDFDVGADPTDAIFELAPDKAQVLFGVAGAESSEFVFCDNGLWYIPISVTNPLKPGSVQFISISKDGCANVQPRGAQEFIAYVSSSGKDVMIVLPTGYQTRPNTTRQLTGFHSHLFSSVIALAVPGATANFPERYLYALNSDGKVVVGKITTEEGQLNIEATVGWLPWTGGATVKWISARGGATLLTSNYAPNGIGTVMIAEVLDAAQYLDASQLYNTQPTGLPIPIGKGPLWWLAGGTVDLIDQTTRMMGTYTIDADGFLIPQNNGGEDFTSATLVVGQAWSATLEPFTPSAPPGQSAGQRMRKRRVGRVVVTVKDSTGFMFARLKSGQTIPGGPALGTIMANTRITTWNQGDIVTAPPPLREQSYSFRPVGRDNDPRMALIKDTPGPLIIEEIGMDASI